MSNISARLEPCHDRLLHLDVLRGFALFGILLVNFEWFFRPIMGITLGAEPDLSGINLLAQWLVQALAEGKFYPLFSMLFGAGFALMFERAMAREAPFWGLYLRRIFLLGLFGAAHMFLVWAGDILLVYSLTAFVMVLFFRKTPLRRLWKWALTFIFLPVIIMWLGAAAIEATRLDPDSRASVMAQFEQDEQEHRERVEQAAEIHATGSWRENVGQRLRDGAFTLSHAIFWVPPVLGFFLIGRWLISAGPLTQPAAHQSWLRQWRRRGLLLGLPLSVAATAILHGRNVMVPTADIALGLTLATIAGLLLALAYLSTVTLGARRLAFLAPAGQMALTNYLLQSLFWTWAAYGHGLGLWGQVPRAGQVLLALAFFAAQILLSRWWLKHYRFGPAEWLWRCLSYWRLQPMKKSCP